MVAQSVDHLVSGLETDLDRNRQEFAARKKCENQLYRLLAELVETERKYVQDLEQVNNRIGIFIWDKWCPKCCSHR